MKKTFTLTFAMFMAVSGSAQLKVQTEKLIRKDNALYIRENGMDFRVDKKTITVKLKKGEILDEKNFIIERQNKLGYIDITIPEGNDIEEYAKKLDESGIFELVEYNTIGEFFSITPNDNFYDYQWNLERIKVDKAWKYTMGDSIVKVAIIDTGVDYNHKDIGYGTDGYRNIIENTNWNTNYLDSHGTKVAGVIGAKTNNTWGIAGISGGNGYSGVTMIPYYVGSNGNPIASIIDDAILDAMSKGAKVIQLSLGVAYNSSIVSAINYAYNNGTSIVCAAGNIMEDSISSVSFPAYLDNVIAVGATSIQNLRLNSSRYGEGLDLVAPGSAFYSTCPNNSYDFVSGTSVAAPHVSGVIALMLTIKPSLTPHSIRTILRNTAYKNPFYTYNSNGWNNEVGYGMVDAYAALNAILPININGNYLICDSASYCINNLPTGSTVLWEIDNEYYNDSEVLFKTDYPVNNQCMIVRDNLLALNDTLIARVYDENDVLIRTLKQKVQTRTKAMFPISVEDNSWPPVISSASVAEDDPAKVPSGALVKMGSPRFNGMNITSSGACTYLLHSGDSVKLTTTGIAGLHCTNATNCDQFTLYFYTKKKPLFPNDSLIVHGPIIEEPIIHSGGGKISISINQIISYNDDLYGDYQTIPLPDDRSWDLSIYRYNDGKRMYSQKLQGSYGEVNINGWKSNIYIVRIVYGNQVFTRKITI